MPDWSAIDGESPVVPNRIGVFEGECAFCGRAGSSDERLERVGPGHLICYPCFKAHRSTLIP